MQRTRVTLLQCLLYAITGLAAMSGAQASAATLCVNQNPKSGCPYTTIGAAVAAAASGDTVNVAPGRYAEDVHIIQPVSLIGAGAKWTIINAKGLSNGIFIDGINGAATITPGANTLTSVTVTGFTVQNANFEGILALNASYVTVWGNLVTGNNRALDLSHFTCPNIPPFETSEGEDCGEGIHLTGVDHSTITDNTIEQNSGGILLSDDTGPTNANLIKDNEVRDNPFDCGITLASHPQAAITGASSPLGVFGNTIANNESTENGFQVPGAGAGVGIFNPSPGTKAYGNVVIGNRLTNNGLPGVAMHSHAPNQNLDDTLIIGNYIAGNGADTGDAATPGPTGINVFGVTPITGTVISHNVIDQEAVDIAVKTGALVTAHLNNLVGKQIGVDNLDAGSVDATENWWGCAKGPGARGCTTVSGANVTTTPFLTQPFQSAGTN